VGQVIQVNEYSKDQRKIFTNLARQPVQPIETRNHYHTKDGENNSGDQETKNGRNGLIGGTLT